jgi:hypothetical protein
LWGGVRGGGRDSGEDGVENGVEFDHHIAIGEAQNAIALRVQEGGAPFIVRAIAKKAVLIPINFNDQHQSVGTEINNVRPDRHLPAEVRAFERQSRANRPPQPALGICHFFAHRIRRFNADSFART